jgi:hypothetical protein
MKMRTIPQRRDDAGRKTMPASRAREFGLADLEQIAAAGGPTSGGTSSGGGSGGGGRPPLQSN